MGSERVMGWGTVMDCGRVMVGEGDGLRRDMG